jgi:biotin synthase
VEKEICVYNMISNRLQSFPSANKKEITELVKYFLEATEEEEAEQEVVESLALYSAKLRNQYYGPRVFFRGLLEFSNYCKNDCYYCGIRRGNKNANRYRLTEDEIFDSCCQGYKMGFRTFVLQCGEDNYFTDATLCAIVHRIKCKFPHCAVTLSLGERSY